LHSTLLGPLAFARFLSKNLKKMLDGLFSTPALFSHFFNKNRIKIDAVEVDSLANLAE
jgi:hypothetical protein